MIFTLLALHSKFEEAYLEELKAMSTHIAKYPEEAKKSFFTRRRNGDYEMTMVDNGWTCFKAGFKAAGGEIHGES